MKLFTLYDSKVEAYLQPVFFENENVAIRSVGRLANTADQELHVFAKDFTLFLIGEYDRQKGEITPLPKKAICNILELVNFETTGKQYDLEEVIENSNEKDATQ